MTEHVVKNSVCGEGGKRGGMVLIRIKQPAEIQQSIFTNYVILYNQLSTSDFQFCFFSFSH